MELQLQVGVKILLKNKKGKFLLLHRNWDKYPEVKKDQSWDIVGGRIEKGTPLLENLKREIFEETKLNLTKEPKLISAQDILRTDKHVVRLTYLGEIEGEPVLDEFHDSFKWLTLEEMKNESSLDPYAREVLGKI
ncbi:MAG TPA: NUDIX domain-containing protein [Candidatus Paceibacterota bacterium]